MKQTSKGAPQSAAAAEMKDAIEKNQIAKGDGPTVPPAATPTPTPTPKDDKKEKAKEKKPKPQRVEQIHVRHDFTVPEAAALGGILADKSRILADLEGEAKACARQYKDKMTTLEAEIDNVVNKIKEGFEMVPVDAIVMVQINRSKKEATKYYYRKDTGVLIKSDKIISNTELELFNILPDKRDPNKPLDAKLLSSQV